MAIEIVLAVLVAPLLLINVIGPLFIYKNQKLPAKVNFVPIDENDFLAQQSSEFEVRDGQIKTIGFSYLGSSKMEDKHTDTLFSMYAHERDNTAASLVTVKSKIQEITYVEFSQLYSDGTMLNVFNSTEIPAYPRMPMKIMARYPEIKDCEELYEIMKRLRASLYNSAEQIPFDTTNCFQRMADFIAKESDEMVKLGYCKNEIDDQGKRALTLKGAYLLTWGVVFPGKILRKKSDLKYARRLLESA